MVDLNQCTSTYIHTHPCLSGMTPVCRALLAKGASVQSRNAAGCTALHLAAAEGKQMPRYLRILCIYIYDA